MKTVSLATIDQYIRTFPKSTQKLLQEMRATIRKAAPQAEEGIKYGIPTFTQGGNLVHFGGYAKHIGFYPTPSGIQAFKTELARYKTSKGAVQFPLSEPLPLALITKIVRFRVKENMASIQTKI